MKKQAGFTLIELVMVIVILGVLAAVALPKFVNLASDARTAAITAVAGSMRSTNSMIYAKASVNDQLGATGSLTAAMVPAASSPPLSTVFGFAGTVAELVKLMDLSSEFDTATLNVIKHTGGTTAANCSVTYAPATSAAVPPTYTVLTTGC